MRNFEGLNRAVLVGKERIDRIDRVTGCHVVEVREVAHQTGIVDLIIYILGRLDGPPPNIADNRAHLNPRHLVGGRVSDGLVQIRGLRNPLTSAGIIIPCITVTEFGQVGGRRTVNLVHDEGRLQKEFHAPVVVIMPVAEDISYVADAVRLAVAYRLVAEIVLSAVDDDRIVVIVVDDLTVTSAIGVRLLWH